MSHTAITDAPLAAITKRQAEVLECVALRLTIKETASRLQISESAVNGHIKALKLQYGVNSLSELADIWRRNGESSDSKGCSFSTPINSRLPSSGQMPATNGQDDAGPVLTFAQPLAYHQRAPWESLEPEIVPGVLRGINAKWNRVIAILLVALGLLALTLLGLGVGQGINAVLSDPPAAPPTHL